MLFDQLAKLVERYEVLRPMKQSMDDAHRFDLTSAETIGHGVKSPDQWTLPFPVTAIELSDWLLLLQDGIFVAAQNISGTHGEFIVAGLWRGTNKPNIRIGAVWTFIRRGRNDCIQYRIHSEFDETLKGIVKDALRDVATAIGWSLGTINQGNRQIIEVPPKKEIQQTADRIVRSHNRPSFILIRPAEIRRKYGPTATSFEPGTKKRPHDRRGHFRVFRSERWGKLRGQRRWVEATRVGNKNAVVEQQRYRVVLD